jgi:hypothetical protein
MELGGITRRFRGAFLAALLVACARTTSGDPSGNGGSGAGAALPDCENPLAAETPCSVPSAHCGGPCSNSWRADNACNNGKWEFTRVVPCGPNASHAPQCKDNGGQLMPCCPESNLACVGKPEGYPGFGCTPRDGSFCSCTCSSGVQACAC